MNSTGIVKNTRRFWEDFLYYYPEAHPNEIPVYMASMDAVDFRPILTEKQWDVMFLFLVEGLNFKDISGRLNHRESTSRKYYIVSVRKIAGAVKQFFMYDLSKAKQ